MKVKHSNDGITIVIPDLTSPKFPLTLFAICWNVLNIYFCYGLLSALAKDDTNIIVSIMVVFLSVIPFSIFAFSLIHETLLEWFNRTYIFANDNVITIDYKPIPKPSFDKKIIKRDKLEQLYIKEQFATSITNNRTLVYYFRALMKSGADKKLLRFSSKDKNVVFSIRETLENNFDIKVKFYPLSE